MWIGPQIDPLRDACGPWPAVASSVPGAEAGRPSSGAARRQDGLPYNPAVPTLRIPDALRRYAGGEALLEAAGATVGEVLDDAFRRHPGLRIRLVDEAGVVRSHLAVFRNEGQLPREQAAGESLGPGDTLTLLLAVDGG